MKCVAIFAKKGYNKVKKDKGSVITLDNIKYAEALNSAIASVEIEGYEVDEQQKAFCLEFVSGNMNKEDFINFMLERCRA